MALPYEGYGYYPTLSFSNPLSSPNLNAGGMSGGYGSIGGIPLADNLKDLNNVEARRGFGAQMPTNVLDVRGQLSPLLSSYGSYANSLAGTNPYLGRISLGQNFAGADAFQNQLKNGIDYFGRLGISEGLQNIALQREAANAQLAQQLGRIPGNNTLLGILQNQNLFRSQLAANPLISQAQKDTSGRVESQINLQNQLQQLMNQTRLQQTGFNQQAQLAELQARLGLLQPQQNLLEILSNLQGQARGVTTQESQTLGRNFK